MKQRKIGKIMVLAIMMMLMCVYRTEVKATATSTYTVEVHGHYEHPVSGVVEDSGGESSKALGESMVGSVIDGTGLLEIDKKDNLYLSIRFHLMNSISKVAFEVQDSEDGKWNSVEMETTATKDDTSDMRIRIPGEEAIIRVSARIEAMGRDVIFYATFDNKSEGNAGEFALLPEDVEQELNEEIVEKETAGGESIDGKTTDEKTADLETTDEVKYILDDSFWMMAFAIIFCANIFSGLTLLLVIIVVRRIRSYRSEIKAREKKSEKENK